MLAMTTNTSPDGRVRGPVPERAPAGMKLVTRERVAQICGVSTRTVTRWVQREWLAKYLDQLDRVRFSEEAAYEMNRLMDEDSPPDG